MKMPARQLHPTTPHEAGTRPEAGVWRQAAESVQQAPEKALDGPEKSRPPIDAGAELSAIQASIEKLAKSGEQIKQRSGQLTPEKPPAGTGRQYVSPELKDLAYGRLLRRARKQFNFAERQLSRLIHQPVVETISELGGKTVARPSALLGSGLAGLFGGGIYYLIVKTYGYEYRFSLFLYLLGAGLVAGLVVEAAAKITRRGGA